MKTIQSQAITNGYPKYRTAKNTSKPPHGNVGGNILQISCGQFDWLSGGAMSIEWHFGLIRPLVSLVTGAMSFYDRIVGKAPTADFAPGKYGAVLHLKNERGETVIVENVGATPPLLAFSAGTGVGDTVRAIVRQRSDAAESALTVLKTGEESELNVITFDPFNETPEDQKIRVTLQWRASSRSPFSRPKISKTITVKDVKDLEAESDRRRMRPD